MLKHFKICLALSMALPMVTFDLAVSSEPPVNLQNCTSKQCRFWRARLEKIARRLLKREARVTQLGNRKAAFEGVLADLETTQKADLAKIHKGCAVVVETIASGEDGYVDRTVATGAIADDADLFNRLLTNKHYTIENDNTKCILANTFYNPVYSGSFDREYAASTDMVTIVKEVVTLSAGDTRTDYKLLPYANGHVNNPLAEHGSSPIIRLESDAPISELIISVNSDGSKTFSAKRIGTIGGLFQLTSTVSNISYSQDSSGNLVSKNLGSDSRGNVEESVKKMLTDIPNLFVVSDSE